MKRFTFTGPLAWFMGRSYHLLMMPGVARKSRVVSDWTISLFFPRDVSQLGGLGHPTPLLHPRTELARPVTPSRRVRPVAEKD